MQSKISTVADLNNAHFGRNIRRSKTFNQRFDDNETNILKLLDEYHLSFTELARLIGVSQSVLAALAYGYIAPVYLLKNKLGQPKPISEKLCNFFLLDISDIFPRHSCNIHNKRMESAIDLNIESHSERMAHYDFEGGIFFDELVEILRTIYVTNPSREKYFSQWLEHVMDETSLAEFGARNHRSRALIGAHFNKIMQYINWGLKRHMVSTNLEKRLYLKGSDVMYDLVSSITTDADVREKRYHQHLEDIDDAIIRELEIIAKMKELEETKLREARQRDELLKRRAEEQAKTEHAKRIEMAREAREKRQKEAERRKIEKQKKLEDEKRMIEQWVEERRLDRLRRENEERRRVIMHSKKEALSLQLQNNYDVCSKCINYIIRLASVISQRDKFVPLAQDPCAVSIITELNPLLNEHPDLRWVFDIHINVLHPCIGLDKKWVTYVNEIFDGQTLYMRLVHKFTITHSRKVLESVSTIIDKNYRKIRILKHQLISSLYDLEREFFILRDDPIGNKEAMLDNRNKHNELDGQLYVAKQLSALTQQSYTMLVLTDETLLNNILEGINEYNTINK